MSSRAAKIPCVLCSGFLFCSHMCLLSSIMFCYPRFRSQRLLGSFIMLSDVLLCCSCIIGVGLAAYLRRLCLSDVLASLGSLRVNQVAILDYATVVVRTVNGKWSVMNDTSLFWLFYLDVLIKHATC